VLSALRQASPVWHIGVRYFSRLAPTDLIGETFSQQHHAYVTRIAVDEKNRPRVNQCSATITPPDGTGVRVSSMCKTSRAGVMAGVLRTLVNSGDSFTVNLGWGAA
jgi:hypothetical protein